ncbi:hypothetical protein [Streptomyces sp. NPDC051684]|uniref:hypothetical protein n=1 Tax=Streptomyces sp. NPDC051684 TaxID=3365670 RepID=UPI0037A3406F
MSPAETTAAADNAQDGEQKQQEESAESPEQQRQKAWAARQALITHGPDFISTLVGGDQFGQSGGVHVGDTILHIGGRSDVQAPRQRSGPIPQAHVVELADVFREPPAFRKALARLRTDRVVLLVGGRETGRRAAAVMLLHQLGVAGLRSLAPGIAFAALPEHVEAAGGYVARDLTVSRNRPLHETHLHALREQLERTDAYLVVTVDPSAALNGVPCERWEPPGAEDILHAHVVPAIGPAGWDTVCGRPPVREFLARRPSPGEIKQFAQHLVALHRGETDEEQLAAFGEQALAERVSRWLTEEKPILRDKAFLVSIAVFDKAPYAVTAELSDDLFVLLHAIEEPRVAPCIPVFGSPREERIRLAEAVGSVTTVVTEWGPLQGQFVAEFRDKDTANTLLTQVWNLHPSARPALAEWIRHLAQDRRPLVRTRAASAAAQLATADLTAVMAHLVEPWADSNDANAWLTAANALTMAQLLGVPTIPQILHGWCTGERKGRRWTAIRTYGLLGPLYHEDALKALLDAIHQQVYEDGDLADTDEEDTKEEASQLADALQLLLLAVEGPVLTALADRLDDKKVRAHAVFAFLRACGQTTEGSDRPFVLDWYARATESGDAAVTHALTTFWRAVLNDRDRTAQALHVLGSWVLIADDKPWAESALASLLPRLVGNDNDYRRISHLLRTVRNSDGERSPAGLRLEASLTAA